MQRYRRSRQSFVAKLNSAVARLIYLPRTLQLIWSATKGWTIVWLILLIIQGLLPVATVYLTKLVVDSLVAAMKIGIASEGFRLLIVPTALMAGVLLLSQLLQGILTWTRTIQSELIQDHIKALVHKKSTAVDLGFYEMPENHDRLHQAQSDASSRSLALLESGGGLLQNSITLLAMSTVLLHYGVWLPFVLLFSTLPAFYVVLISNRQYHRWWQQTTTDRRWTEYYDLFLTYSAIAAELRLFDLGPYFQSSYQVLRRRLRRERLKLLKEQSLAKLCAGVIGLVISGATMAWMLWGALQGLLSLGDLALFYQAFNQGQSLMRSLLSNVGEIHNNSLFVGNLFEFLQLEPQVIDPPNPQPAPLSCKKDIRFQEVTFRYPGSDRTALQNFNLTIPAGQIVAIVGDNGAGKSTLLKLLCRFYDPTAGRIELDGIDIRNFSVKDFRRLITVLFQWSVPYQATAAVNIAIGDISAQPSIAEIETAARGAGAHEVIARLPQGYDTLLGKSFVKGADLSGGEWQRVALARAFLRRAQIIVLDEPTSAMDSWAEADWLERFRTLANGRTAIVITHRFTLAMRADIIHVMRNGQIVESGSHDELLKQGGLYAQSWKAQTQASIIPPIESSLA